MLYYVAEKGPHVIGSASQGRTGTIRPRVDERSAHTFLGEAEVVHDHLPSHPSGQVGRKSSSQITKCMVLVLIFKGLFPFMLFHFSLLMYLPKREVIMM